MIKIIAPLIARLIIVLCGGLFASIAVAVPATQSQAFAEKPTQLVVGVRHTPPFAIRDAQGEWHGVSVALWRQVANQLGVTFVLREQPTVTALLDELAAGKIDIGIGALTVTAAREETVDFSHAFYAGGLGIAARQGETASLFAVVLRLFSWEFLSVIGGLLALLTLVGVLIWLFERRRNPAQFGGGTANGVGAGLWWSAVTMTTVGYGDKAPITFGGRILALVWMFTSIITISGFTAAIASSMTIGQLNDKVQSAADLPKVRVATVLGSTSDTYLQPRLLSYKRQNNIQAALDELTHERVDAVVYDASILKYLLKQQNIPGTGVLPEMLSRQDYAFGLSPKNPLTEKINRELLRYIQTPEWDSLLAQYLGE